METFHKKLGRPRKYIKKNYGLKDAWVYYKNKSKDTVDESTYKSIVRGFLSYLSKQLIERGELLIPEKLGTLLICGKKPNFKVTEDGKINGLSIDWKSTKEMWKEEKEVSGQYVYFLNEHTNNVRYKTIWLNNRVLVSNKTIYKFILCRSMKRAIAKSIKNGHEYKIKV